MVNLTKTAAGVRNDWHKILHCDHQLKENVSKLGTCPERSVDSALSGSETTGLEKGATQCKGNGWVGDELGTEAVGWKEVAL